MNELGDTSLSCSDRMYIFGRSFSDSRLQLYQSTGGKIASHLYIVNLVFYTEIKMII